MILLSLSLPHALADNSFTVTVAIQGLPGNLSTNLYVNGIYNGTIAGGASTTYFLSEGNGPDIISVDSYVQGSENGVRYYCENTTWDTNSSGSKVFTYVSQYFLTVQSAYGSVSGQGWYTSGSVAHATVSDDAVPEGQGTRNLFDGWSGDATGTQLVSDSIRMDGPKAAVANWITEFYLTVASNPDNVTGLSGSGWYASGTQANFSASAILPLTSDNRLRFDHWSGESTGQEPAGSVSMDRPKMVIANYVSQYLLSVIYSPAAVANSYNETHAGWYDANSEVQLGPAPAVVNLSTTDRLQFAGWLENGSDSPNLLYTVLLDIPRNVTLSYNTQYYLNVQSAYGATTGSGWYNQEAKATFTASTSAGTWPITYTLTGWTVTPPNEAAISNGDAWTIIVNAPYVVQAQWSMNYLPLIMLFVAATVAGTGVIGAVVGYRRGLFGRPHPMVPPAKSQGAASIPPSSTVCSNCGNTVATPAGFCDNCGSTMREAQDTSLDDAVYDYIVRHEGVISLSSASAELGMPVGELKKIAERLKAEGRLS